MYVWCLGARKCNGVHASIAVMVGRACSSHTSILLHADLLHVLSEVGGVMREDGKDGKNDMGSLARDIFCA